MTTQLRAIALFAGSSEGNDPARPHAAYQVGARLAKQEIAVVYGAGGRGLMGALSQGALDHGGRVIGVIPRDMVVREWGRSDLTECHVVASMHERKAVMGQLADAFIALPGGLGTVEEIVEAWSWLALGFIDKPVAFLDHDNFWQPFMAAMRGLVGAGFMARPALDAVVVAPDLDGVLDGIRRRLPEA